MMNPKPVLLLLCSFLLTACATKPKVLHSKNWVEATHEVVAEYKDSAHRHLKPAFEKAGVHYPPRRLALLAFKREQRMEVWAKGSKKQPWTHIKTYPILAHSGGPGPKLKEYDRQIPEGLYRIISFDPFSSLHLSMQLNYPNAFDLWHAKLDGRKHPGNNIFIHGKALSAGCLAVGDRAIEDLFVLVYDTGKWKTEVVIAPNDLRQSAAAKPKRTFPGWVHDLDQQLRHKLNQFT